MDAFWRGVIAGYGIAVPVGAIAILIVETGLRRGFAMAFSAGAGAATADLIYASVAALAGTALAVVLTPVAGILRVASAGVLILIGAWGLYQLRRSPNAAEGREVPTQSFLQTYAMVLGLTLLNPLTVTYFAALILGMNDCARAKHLSSCGSNASPLLFVVGAFLASLSWQSLLAGIGALAHRHLPPRFRVVTSVVGNLVIVGMGIAILLRVM